eukprot:7840803-Lingulodinium_polyedra.AAC.1
MHYAAACAGTWGPRAATPTWHKRVSPKGPTQRQCGMRNARATRMDANPHRPRGVRICACYLSALYAR